MSSECCQDCANLLGYQNTLFAKVRQTQLTYYYIGYPCIDKLYIQYIQILVKFISPVYQSRLIISQNVGHDLIVFRKSLFYLWYY